MSVAPIFTKEYKLRDGRKYTLTLYFPDEDEVIAVDKATSTTRQIYVEYPECYIEIQYPDGGLNTHLLSDKEKLKKFLHDWSGIWGANFWRELKDNCLI